MFSLDYTTSNIEKAKNSLGVAVLAVPNEPLSSCLDSIYNNVDEIVVFTWAKEQAETAARYGAKIIEILPVSHVELIRQEMQSTLSTDWALILDPDELIEPGAIQFFRDKIQLANPDVVGFWVPQRMFFIGDELCHSFPGVKQMRLFRRNRVQYDQEIHKSPVPVNGYYEYMADGDPGIKHQFVSQLKHRLERHLCWAEIEAEELCRSGASLNNAIEIFEAGIEELKSYTVDKKGLRDGTKGLINALLHSWKRMVTLCYLWEIQGANNMPIDELSELEELIYKLKLPKSGY